MGARTRDGDTLGDPISKCLADRIILARRRRTCDPSPRILRGGRGRWLRACPGRQWSRVFRRYGGTVPRAQGQLCCQHYGSGLDPIIRGSSATAYGARVLRRTRVEAPRGFRGGLTVRWPGRYCRSVVQGTGTADAMVVKGSVAHRKCRRRGEHPGRARRVRPLSPTPQGNRWNKGISLEQAIDSCWGWAGRVKL